LNKGIPIGADIVLVRLMTRNFIIRTIVARGKVGIKDSRASVLLEPLLLGFVAPELLLLPFVSREPLVLAVLPLEPLLPAFVLVGPQVLAVLRLGPLLPLFVLREPLVQAVLRLGLLLPLFVLREPLVLPFVLLGLPVRHRAPLEPPGLGVVNPEKPLPLRKSLRNSFPTGASSQIAQSGRSGNILKATSGIS